MKKNPISAIAGWKSAALLALVAMVAAVAFSGVLTTTQNADAAVPGTGIVHAGDIVSVTFTPATAGEAVAFGLADGTDVGGVFVYSETGSLSCKPDRLDDAGAVIDEACDVGTLDSNSDGTADDPDADVTVQFRVSAAGTTNGGTLDASDFSPSGATGAHG